MLFETTKTRLFLSVHFNRWPTYTFFYLVTFLHFSHILHCSSCANFIAIYFRFSLNDKQMKSWPSQKGEILHLQQCETGQFMQFCKQIFCSGELHENLFSNAICFSSWWFHGKLLSLHNRHKFSNVKNHLRFFLFRPNSCLFSNQQ